MIEDWRTRRRASENTIDVRLIPRLERNTERLHESQEKGKKSEA